jgi:hypothetical protein
MPKKPRRKHKGLWLPIRLLSDDRFNFPEKGIIAEVDSLDGEDGCFAGNGHFAKFLRVSEDRVSRMVGVLVKKGVLIRGLKWTPRGRKRTLSVVAGVIEPIGENTVTPIGENDGSQPVKTTTPIGENTGYYKEENTSKEQGEDACASDPPPFAPPAFKKNSPEERSWTQFQVAKDQLDTHLPIEFFEFLEKEVIGQWDKIPWTVTLVNNWHRQIWMKFEYKIASQALSECSADSKGWKISIAEVVEKCRAVKRKQVEAKRRAENIERLKRQKKELKDGGGFIKIRNMTDGELETEYNRKVQDCAKPFELGLYTREMKRRKDALIEEGLG